MAAVDEPGETIPGRILKIAQDYLGTKEIPTPVLWRMEREIVPGFRPEISDPAYDQWLTLLLHSFAPRDTYRTDMMLYSIIPYPGVDSQLIRDSRRLKERIEQAQDSERRDDLKWLAAEIGDRMSDWETTYALENRDRVSRRFLDEFFRYVDSDPRSKKRSPRGRNKPPPSSGRNPDAFLERLPKPLWNFANEVYPEVVKNAVFWNALRDYVYPHFIAAAMNIDAYRSFLALAIRHYGLYEDGEILSEAKALLSELQAKPDTITPYDAERTGMSAELLAQKCEDLIADARRAHDRGRG